MIGRQFCSAGKKYEDGSVSNAPDGVLKGNEDSQMNQDDITALKSEIARDVFNAISFNIHQIIDARMDLKFMNNNQDIFRRLDERINALELGMEKRFLLFEMQQKETNIVRSNQFE